METKAFNSDPIVCQEFLKLKNLFNVKCVLETGTYEGNTTIFLAENFEAVYSVEITEHFYQLSKSKCNNLSNVKIFKDSSEKFLSQILPSLNEEYESIIFYLDAHWENYWPLKDEILEISKYFKNRAIIIIDDFYVPNRNFQFDSYQNLNCDWNFIENEIKKCYDDNEFLYYYLNITERNMPIRDGSIGGVGKIYIIPKNLMKKYNITEEQLCFSEKENKYSNLEKI
jgi:hypothetical protein